MAAQAWKIFTRAKRAIARGEILLHTGVYKMCLCTSAATANLAKFTNTGISTWASVGSEISARGGYAANGRTIPAWGWTVGASTKQYKTRYTTLGLIFTADGSALNNIKFAVIRNSTGAGAGKVICWCSLSASQFTINSPNTLTIFPATGGVFVLA